MSRADQLLLRISALSLLLLHVCLGSCVDQAAKLSPAELLGGWRKAKPDDIDVQLQEQLTDVAQLVVNGQLNRDDSNNIRFYKPSKDPVSNGVKVVNVYTKVVAGLMVCFTFEAEAAGCKDARDVEFCTQGSSVCTAEAFLPLDYGQLVNGAPVGPVVEDAACQL